MDWWTLIYILIFIGVSFGLFFGMNLIRDVTNAGRVRNQFERCAGIVDSVCNKGGLNLKEELVVRPGEFAVIASCKNIMENDNFPTLPEGELPGDVKDLMKSELKGICGKKDAKQIALIYFPLKDEGYSPYYFAIDCAPGDDDMEVEMDLAYLGGEFVLNVYRNDANTKIIGKNAIILG